MSRSARARPGASPARTPESLPGTETTRSREVVPFSRPRRSLRVRSRGRDQQVLRALAKIVVLWPEVRYRHVPRSGELTVWPSHSRLRRLP